MENEEENLFEAEVNEALGTLPSLPEAPYSVNFRVLGTDGIDYQFTTRAMTEGQLFKNIAGLKARTKAEQKSKPLDAVTTTVHATCPMHQVAMKEISSQYGTFFSHGKKLDDGSWINCKGKGWGK